MIMKAIRKSMYHIGNYCISNEQKVMEKMSLDSGFLTIVSNI